MSTDRITRLQSLLDRIKKNAALPKRSLGSNLFVGGTFGARTDIATGPAVPAASLAHAPVQSDVAARAPLPRLLPLRQQRINPRQLRRVPLLWLERRGFLRCRVERLRRPWRLRRQQSCQAPRRRQRSRQAPPW